MKTRISEDLLAWYDANKRFLPWRNDTDAYRVWVSEIMLQQTRVETVIPYYNRWMQRFPDVHALADADQQDVLMSWEGLGYYSRARNLHGAACVVRERHNGTLPSTYESLRALPGIGDYTAGAIASIAYNQRHPAVDGNVRRVLSRLFDVPAPDAKSVRPLADALVDEARPGDFNQALMELGAVVCTPRNPSCEQCPLKAHCRALRNGSINGRPGRKTRAAVPHETTLTLVLLRDDEVLMSQRPENGLLGGTWEFLAVEKLPGNARPLGSVTHVFTHKRITYDVHLARGRRNARARERWLRLDALAQIPISTAQRKIERLLREVLG